MCAVKWGTYELQAWHRQPGVQEKKRKQKSRPVSVPSADPQLELEEGHGLSVQEAEPSAGPDQCFPWRSGDGRRGLE